jgi:hypothetical protein
VNTLNKELWTTDNMWFFSLGVGKGANRQAMKCYTGKFWSENLKGRGQLED